MIIADDCYTEMINSVSREIEARVELLEATTLLQTFTHDGALQSFTVERAGDSSKFFGYGICQKLTLKLIDKERTINIFKNQELDVAVGVGCDYLYTFPVFFVDEVERDENTNALTVTAYDVIYQANAHTVSELSLPQSYTIFAFAAAVAGFLGIPIKLDNVSQDEFKTSYTNGAHFDGTESLREALDDVAEATGTIYYVNENWELTFRKLDISGSPVLEIDKSKYFNLSVKSKYTLTGITHTTELGDNVTADINVAGAHQYLRENAFLVNRDDVGTLLNNIFSKVQSLAMYQFDLKWRGNFLLEIGDKISITTKDNTKVNCYAINDTVTYNGGFIENTSWEYNESQHETASNPSTIGEALKKATARVDKINGEIILEVKETQDMVKNMQIGARNLLRNTDFNDDVLSNWAVWAATSTLNIVDGYMQVTNVGGAVNFGVYGKDKTAQLQAGQEYTLSFDAYADSELELDYCFLMSDDGNTSLASYLKPILTTEIKHYEYTFTSPKTIKCSIMLGAYNVADYTGSFYFKNLQLEKGNKATDWSPAPEDIDANLEDFNTKLSEIKVTTDNITARVEQNATNTNNQLDTLQQNMELVTNKVDATMTSDQVELLVSKTISNGVSSVETSTGFTFDERGLSVTKSNSEISTTITEDGMTVYKGDTAMLTANNQGVEANNLKSNYIIISGRSRFEKYGSDRCGCYWLGSE